MDLGKRVSLLKNQNHLTTETLARLSGVPKGTINKILNGETQNPTARTLSQLARALGCTLTRISSQKEIYLLSPETVMVVPYDGIRRMSDQEINARWPDPDAVNDRYGWNQQGGYQERSSNYGRRGYAGRYDEGYGSYQSAYAR